MAPTSDERSYVYAFTQDVPIEPDFYRQIREGLGDDPPEGMYSHVVVALPDGGVRYIDVWESEEHFLRYLDGRQRPVVHPLLRAKFGERPPGAGGPPPEPPRVAMDVIDVWTGPGT